jgi:CheY-like chemotaxis protein
LLSRFIDWRRIMGYILVIHDDTEDLGTLRLFLSVFDYDVKVSSNWEEASALFDGDLNCDLIITKAKMNEIYGYDFARHVRNSPRPDIPILAIGSAENDIDPTHFNSVLETPFKLKILGDAVASFMPQTPKT